MVCIGSGTCCCASTAQRRVDLLVWQLASVQVGRTRRWRCLLSSERPGVQSAFWSRAWPPQMASNGHSAAPWADWQPSREQQGDGQQQQANGSKVSEAVADCIIVGERSADRLHWILLPGRLEAGWRPSRPQTSAAAGPPPLPQLQRCCHPPPPGACECMLPARLLTLFPLP